MPFVKLDCGIINSTIWFDRAAREVFITALLMAEPLEILEPMPQIAVHSLDLTGWVVPAGWYGFVPASGPGIIDRAKVQQREGKEALERLGSPEMNSRTPEFDGRRLVRVDGGYIVLNYMKYRERDYTSAERSRRYRLKKQRASLRSVAVSHRDITQAEAEAEVDQNQDQDPRADARKSIASIRGLLQSATHSFVEEEPGIEDGEIAERLKSLSAKSGVRYDGRSIQKVIDAVRGQRSR